MQTRDNTFGVHQTNGIEYILDHVPLEKFHTILDIGIGNGLATEFFHKKNKTVTGLGLHVSSYGIDINTYSAKNIRIVESDFLEADFKDSSFDAVWASHVLEHNLNPGRFLAEVHRILKPGGYLFVSVPPYKSRIVGGHASTGWNLGQLAYVLLLSGFEVKTGQFIQYGYNITAFVTKSNRALPELNYDKGDIEILKDFFPEELNAKQGFQGDIYEINWPHPIDRNEKMYRIRISFERLQESIQKLLRSIRSSFEAKS